MSEYVGNFARASSDTGTGIQQAKTHYILCHAPRFRTGICSELPFYRRMGGKWAWRAHPCLWCDRLGFMALATRLETRCCSPGISIRGTGCWPTVRD